MTNPTSNPISTSAPHQALRDVQAQAGATVSDVAGVSDGLTVVTRFGSDQEALDASRSGVALYDRSHWGRIEVSDGDRLRFLHNQTTNDFMTLQPGQSCDTVFVTSTARTIDLVSAYVMDDRVLLLTSPGYQQRLMQWMDRFIFFADKVQLSDVTASTAAFSLLGPQSQDLLSSLGVDVGDLLPDHHRLIDFQGLSVRVAAGSGLATPGYTLLVSADEAPTLWQTLVGAGTTPLGETAWERLRIEQGRPAPGAELTEDYNPLEAGLWKAVSFDKGCYIGQETIARLDTYNGVKQQLWGIQLSAIAPPETVIMLGDDKVGRLTSAIATEDGPFGLAYIRTKAGGEGLTVKVGEAEGEVIDVPFLTRSRST